MLHSPPYLFLIRKTAMRYGFYPLQFIQELSTAKFKPSLLCVRGLDSISTLPEKATDGRYYFRYKFIVFPRFCKKLHYCMASSASGQDEPNPALWLATKAAKMEGYCPLGNANFVPAITFRRSPSRSTKGFFRKILSVIFCGFSPCIRQLSPQ